MQNLHRCIVDHYDREELKTLYFELGVKFDALPGDGTAAKARELILYLARRGELEKLLDTLRTPLDEGWDVAALYAALPAWEAGGASTGCAIRTEGGAHVAGGVDTGGGDFVGRDKVYAENVIYQGVQVQVPTIEAVHRHRAALRAQLEVETQKRWGGMAVYIQEEGAALPIQASPYQTGQLGPRQNLLRLLHAADRLLVLGEPGTGKTVALEKLAWELCEGPEPTVPVLIRLFHYAGTPLAEWVRAFLQKTGHLRLDDERALNAFLQVGGVRCCFLFDGLNEVPPDYRDRLVAELVRWMAAHPRHPVVLTSRSQDELWRRLRTEMGQAVVVQPISDAQAQAYLVAHLSERGAALYDRLDPRLQELARTPLLLWLIKEAGVAGEALPGNRGELYARFVTRMLRRDTERRLDVEIPLRVKQAALETLAYHLGRVQRLSCRREEAVAVVARRWGDDITLAENVVGACARHGLLAGEEQVWFAPHQTVQEHFAAQALQALAEQEWALSGWARLRRTAGRLWRGQEGGLAALAADDWWMETFVQLAGLVDDADRLARELAQVNPWLAWWCVEEGQGVADATREVVAERSVRLLESERATDRRRAVAALTRVRNERCVPPLLRAAGDLDAEVSGLAVQGLMELGEAVRPLVKETLVGADRRLWNGAVRYLMMNPEDPLCSDAVRYLVTRLDDPRCGEVPESVWEQVLGLPMVWIPPGPFWMGSEAYDDEKPRRQVTLPGYWIGRYPVTVAQFKTFLKESDYELQDERGLQNPDDVPITYIAWHDALAYCRWLSAHSGLPVALPSEAQWEKAARGPDGHRYPWGDASPTDKLCNFDGNVGRLTPVGRYSPRGDSPYGCLDMAGNVLEWTSSLEKGYPYAASDGREDLEAEGRRVLRGGTFFSAVSGTRCAFRYYGVTVGRLDYVGVRVVVSSIPPALHSGVSALRVSGTSALRGSPEGETPSGRA